MSAALGVLASCGFPAAGSRVTKSARVGLLSMVAQPFHDGLWQGLQVRGYIEGQNLAVERRSADGQTDRLPQLGAELASLKLDVIVAADTSAAQAARAATSTTPIVVVTSGDPVGNGLVASLARPGTNLTGTSSLIPELAGKRLELLQQLVPDATRVLVLVDSADPSIAQQQWDELRAEADAIGAQLQAQAVNGLADIERALPGKRDVDGVVSLLDPLTGGQPGDLVGLVAARSLGAIYPAREFVDVGGLMSYGPNLRDQFTTAATYVDRILRGARPAELPVDRASHFELVINRATAEALGLTISESALLMVDEVV
jgi:putative ABC transport system substrate-binding protein